MAYVDMDPANIISGQPISKSTFGDVVIGNFDQHELDINALENKVYAAGTTAVGNDALSARLGTGITTASTATAQLATITGNISTINTNLGTWSGGTAISRIGTLESAKVGKYQLELTLAANQSTTNNAYHKVTWPAAVTNVGFGTIASNQNFTIPETGWYEISLSMRYAGNATGLRGAWVSLSTDADATRYAWCATEGMVLNTSPPKIITAQPTKLTSGTTLGVWSFQNSGGALDVLSFGAACALKVLWLCP